jgi:SAM-dependent methyltransferase
LNKPSKTLASILELIEGKKHTEANQLLLEAARSMNTWGMSSQEKLNYLMFASRAIQSGGGAKYGYQRVLRKVNKIKHELRFLPSLPAGGMLDLGCGTHDPLGVAAYFYLNGFEPAYCCDLSPPRNPYFSALSMYDIMANVRAFPLRYRFRSAKISEILQRWKAFDIETFEKGDFAAGVSSAGSNLQYHVGDIREFPIAPESLSLVASSAVFEHVDDVDGVLAWLFERTAPGGVHYHFIDLVDHRSYEAHSHYNVFSMLTEPTAPPGVNRLRASQHLEAFAKAGFEVLRVMRETAAVPPDIRARLQPPWRDLAEEDIKTMKLTLVLRRPETA